MDGTHLAWFNPDDQVFYRGAVGHPETSEYVAKFGAKGRPTEVEPRFLRAAEQELRAGIFDTPDSSTIKAIVVLDQVLGLTFRQYRLRECFQIINSPQLVLSVDLGTKFSATGRILPLEEAQVVKQTYARTTFDLAAIGKNVAHILLSDESEKQAVHDVFALHVSNAAMALVKLENSQLATIAESDAGAGAGVGSYATMNSNNDFSLYNPLTDIDAQYDAIAQSGFQVDTVAMHPTVWKNFRSNTFVRYHNPAAALDAGTADLGAIGYPQVKTIFDPDLTRPQAYEHGGGQVGIPGQPFRPRLGEGERQQGQEMEDGARSGPAGPPAQGEPGGGHQLVGLQRVQGSPGASRRSGRLQAGVGPLGRHRDGLLREGQGLSPVKDGACDLRTRKWYHCR